MVRKILGLMAMLCLFFSMAKAQNESNDQTKTVLKAGDICPAFALKDTTGAEVSFESFRGKYVYIDVWASWCYPCRKEIPFFKQLEKDFEGKNIAFVGVNVDFRDFRWLGSIQFDHIEGIQWKVVDKGFEEAFGIDRIPRCILLGPDGNVLKIKITRPSDPKTKEFLSDLKGI
ncbi:TlpA family protein disulfide reductase [Mangrovibacterium diazotrophicum]|uniref:Thiol-disulfide isomerase/thioredoxin n=1 Tax=Mangrovibacterium diazotrophicum TaxID=1261403 RepID=A0A419VXD4_9BACT|nr:TlpA disulfide reductase family protein [Mangrovibacterium diazotrophicum]RKD87887.1 thiol-disulfide isomerase/thioredoxin [Mangrovibacterium diazotrophicum]